MNFLAAELEGIAAAARDVLAAAGAMRSNESRLTLSVGATPTVSSAQNLLNPALFEAERVKEILSHLKGEFNLELHAGVYPLLDMQQLATRARPAAPFSENDGFQSQHTMTSDDVGLHIVTEVLSIYPERPNPEVLVGAGTFALGREPCKSYQGWGVVSPSLWIHGPDDHHTRCTFSQRDKTGWIVGRISQEHGILTWQGPQETIWWPRVGEKLSLWPNHACVAGLGFDWYLVIDSDSTNCPEIVDVWVRCRGW